MKCSAKRLAPVGRAREHAALDPVAGADVAGEVIEVGQSGDHQAIGTRATLDEVSTVALARHAVGVVGVR